MSRRKGQRDRRRRKARPWPTEEQIQKMDCSPGRKALLRRQCHNADAARFVGITPQHLGGIINGRIFPSLRLQEKLETRLGIYPVQCIEWRMNRATTATN